VGGSGLLHPLAAACARRRPTPHTTTSYDESDGERVATSHGVVDEGDIHRCTTDARTRERASVRSKLCRG
jgi:hypothetical protein